jgi:hypothetical protein
MTMGVSRREFAKQIGVSEGAVRKAIQTGRIEALPDGTIDPVAALRAWTSNTDPSRIGLRQTAMPAATTQALVRPVVTSDDAKAAVNLITRILMEEGHEDPGKVDYGAARTAETILKARERDLRIAERRKELVPLVSVKQHIEKAFIGYRQAMQRLPSRHVPTMAAELKCDPVLLESLLSKAIAETLRELSSPVVRA